MLSEFNLDLVKKKKRKKVNNWVKEPIPFLSSWTWFPSAAGKQCMQTPKVWGSDGSFLSEAAGRGISDNRSCIYDTTGSVVRIHSRSQQCCAITQHQKPSKCKEAKRKISRIALPTPWLTKSWYTRKPIPLYWKTFCSQTILSPFHAIKAL